MAYLRNDNYLKKLGERIREIRKEKGFTQESLALEMDVEISQISRIERGVLNTSISTIKELADSLEITMASLFDF